MMRCVKVKFSIKIIFSFKIYGLISKEFPKTKIRYLSDGSRVSELVVDPDQFKFIDDGEIKMVKSPDGSKIIMYVVRDGVVILGNNKQMIDEASDNVSDDNSLIISSELLLNSEFGGYLKHFNFVEVN